MPDVRLAPGLAEFIAAHIHSIEQLEVLLLLHRDPSRVLDAERVARELATHHASAEQRLVDLQARGFLAREDGGVRFQPRDPGLAASTAALADAYRTRRVTVIGLIFAAPPSPLDDFSAAFDFRRDKEKP